MKQAYLSLRHKFPLSSGHDLPQKLDDCSTAFILEMEGLKLVLLVLEQLQKQVPLNSMGKVLRLLLLL